MALNPSQTKPVFQTADVPAGPTVTPASDIPKPKTTIKENQMADDYTKDFFDIRGDIKDGRYDLSSRIGAAAEQNLAATENTKDIVLDRAWSLNRDIMDTRTQVQAIGYQVRDGFAAAAKDAEINALKTQVELAKQSTYLSDRADDNYKTLTALINGLRDSDQNRLLVERNTELVAALADGRWYGDWGRFRGAYDSNVQAVNSRLNSVDSQFEATRQGMVNFGTMAGVGQSSTSNNVK